MNQSADVKRVYESPLRKAQAAATRRAIIDAASALFIERGYVATSIEAIAEAAGVSRATVFTSVGGKKALLKTAYDVALVGDDEPIPFPLRPASLAVRAEPDPRRFLIGYTGLVVDINVRLAPIYEAVRGAASADPEVRDVFEAIGTERRIGAGRVVGDLVGKGWPPPRRARRARPRPTSCGSSSTRVCSISSSIAVAGRSSASRRGWPRRSSGSCWVDAMTATPSIEQVIAAIPDWAGRSVTAERIPAGLTNTNFRVEVDGTPCFVRIPGAATELLAVDRGNELFNTRAAATAGVAPRVLHALPEWDVFVLEWLAGADDVGRGAWRARDAAADRGDPAPPPRRPAVPRRLRHVPADGALPRARRRARHRDPGRLPRAPRAAAADRSRARRPSAGDRPVPQRPARRELPRRWRAPVAGRLGVQRQQRPDVRARQHLPRSSATTTAQVEPSCAPPTSARPPLPCSPGCASR